MAVALALVTLILGVMAGMATANYYRFYPAISQIQVNLSTLQWKYVNSTSSFGGATLETNASFTVQNPTDYKGFTMVNLGVPGYNVASAPDNITFHEGTGPTYFAARALDPRTLVTIQLPGFNTTSDAATLAFTHGCTTTCPQISYVFTVSFRVSSFIDYMGHLVISYQCTSQGQPAECIQTDVTIVTTAGGIGGGGGGGGGT